MMNSMSMPKSDLLAVIVACGCMMAAPANAQDFKKTPLPKNHPLVGSWKFQVPGKNCTEVYTVKPDGTSFVTSGEEKGESEFQISLSPSATGFYKWVDKITKLNGKPDCSGSLMELDHVATTYIALHRNGKVFAMCQKEDFDSCIGPFYLQSEK